MYSAYHHIGVMTEGVDIALARGPGVCVEVIASRG